MDGCLFRLLWIACLWPVFAQADAVNNEWFSPVRNLSMGNVGIASADDGTAAMFYNPAALSRNKRAIFEFFNPQVEIGKGVFRLAQNSAGYEKQTALKKTQPLLRDQPHVPSYMGYAVYPNLQAPNFGFGLLWSERAVSFINSQDRLEYRSRYLMIPTMGLAMPLLGSRVRLGVAVRAIQITSNERVVDTDAQGIGYKKDAEEGFGLGLDAGMLLTAPWAGLPTLGFVARNLGDTSMSGAAPYPRAEGTVRRHHKVKGTYDAGFAIFPKVGKRSTLTIAADYRDIQDVAFVDSRRHINLGMELGVNKTFYFRLGASQAYWTAGIGLASKFGNIDFGTYSEELDRRNVREIEDRRFALKLGSKF